MKKGSGSSILKKRLNLVKIRLITTETVNWDMFLVVSLQRLNIAIQTGAWDDLLKAKAKRTLPPNII